MKATRRMPVLGVNIAAGRGGLHTEQRIRFNAMQKRTYRIARLKRAGAEVRDVTRAELVPGTAYGSRVIGMAPVTLHRLRCTMSLALPKKAKSTSLALRYLASPTPQLDPTFGAVEAPLYFWARLAFDGDAATHGLMQRAWRHHITRLGAVKRPWKQLAGPAGATTLTLRKIGWQASSAFHCGTEMGAALDLRAIAPSVIRSFVFTAVETCLWKEWAEAPSAANDTIVRRNCGYWIPDIGRLCSGPGRHWTALQVA